MLRCTGLVSCAATSGAHDVHVDALSAPRRCVGGECDLGEWSLLRDFVYYDPISATTLCKRALGVASLFAIVWTTFVVFSTGLQKGTARFPKVSVACHFLFLLLTLVISAEMMLDTSNDPSTLVCLGTSPWTA